MKNKFKLIAGPCLAESKELLQEIAETLNPIAIELDFDFIFTSRRRQPSS